MYLRRVVTQLKEIGKSAIFFLAHGLPNFFDYSFFLGVKGLGTQTSNVMKLTGDKDNLKWRNDRKHIAITRITLLMEILVWTCTLLGYKKDTWPDRVQIPQAKSRVNARITRKILVLRDAFVICNL